MNEKHYGCPVKGWHGDIESNKKGVEGWYGGTESNKSQYGHSVEGWKIDIKSNSKKSVVSEELNKKQKGGAQDDTNRTKEDAYVISLERALFGGHKTTTNREKYVFRLNDDDELNDRKVVSLEKELYASHRKTTVRGKFVSKSDAIGGLKDDGAEEYHAHTKCNKNQIDIHDEGNVDSK